MLVTALLCSAAYGRVIYVDDDAAGADDGTCWVDAYIYLQDALMEALNSAEEPIEIHVAQGLYRPDQGANQTLGDTIATFGLLDNVTLRGGFAGVGEPDPNARDIDMYQTILSGDLAGNDGPDFANYEENAQAVVTSVSNDETAVLEGFTITGGFGGSGPGLNCYGSNAIIASCTFAANRAASNEGGFGGALAVSGGAPTLQHCAFEYNWATDNGGAIQCQRRANLTVRNCTFSENHAEENGGAIHCHQGSLILTDCEFIFNSAKYGGSVYNLFGLMSASRCTFTANTADSEGGGVYIDSSTAVTLSHCLVAGNRAGAICGGVLVWCDSSPKLSNCTISDNRAPQGPAVAGGLPVLWNCIVWSQEPDKSPFLAVGDGPAVGYSCIQGDVPGPGNFDTDPLFAAPGYWDASGTPDDPNDDVFVEGDYHLKSQAGRWDPNSESWVADETSSPCIDAGDPCSSVGDEPFPNGGIINMGAYGGTAQASKSPAGSSLCGESTYAFVPQQSIVLQTGGFAGVSWTYRLQGQFQVAVDCLTGTALFSHVNASATDDSPFKRTLDLNEAFNMTNLLGAVGGDGTMRFTGKGANESDVIVTLSFKGDSVHLVGETIPPAGSADFFVLNLDAVAQRYGGEKKEERSQK